MKTAKKIIAALLVFGLLFGFAACGKDTEPESIASVAEEKAKVNVTTLKGPTGIGMVKLMQDDENGNSKNDYEFTLASAPDEVSASVLKGEPDIAAVPVNLAAVLYQKTEGKYVVTGINTLGVLYMLDTTGKINSVADLKGKKIYATGQGSTPEYILRYVLEKNGINPDKDVTIEFKSEHAELATLVQSGEAQIALLPEPNVTTTLLNAQNAKIALNMTDEWNKVSNDGSTVVQGCIIAKKEFLDNNKAAYDKFIKEYRESVDFVNSDLENASAAVEKYGIIPKAAVAKKAIPNCNITLVTGNEMKSKLEPFLNVLYNANNKSVGGKLPDDVFYYIG